MTSDDFRNDPLFLRNQFLCDGYYNMPKIKKNAESLVDLSLIGYDQIKLNDSTNTGSYVHFFLDDYKFEIIWKNPERVLEKLRQYKGVLSPQFSSYYTLPLPLQIYNTFRSRWCGAYLQSKGIKVIPSISWGLPQSYAFCFDGIEKGSIFAISTLGVKTEKEFFLQGYKEMLKRVEPQAVICYSSVFPEMKGTLVEIDYAETNHLEHKFFSEKNKSNCVIIKPDNHNTLFNGRTYYVRKQNGYLITTGKGIGGIGRPDFPGWDPNCQPGKGYEWRRTGDPDSGKGSWYNPNTKEKLHPDLGHKEPYGPHWDYDYPGGGNGFRIFPDNTMSPKNYEMEEIYHGE